MLGVNNVLNPQHSIAIGVTLGKYTGGIHLDIIFVAEGECACSRLTDYIPSVKIFDLQIYDLFL